MADSPDPLKPLDLVALLWIGLRGRVDWQRKELAFVLGVSPSMVTYTMGRLEGAGVVGDSGRVSKEALREMLPAVRWFFPAGSSRLVGWGMPTAHAAPGLDLGIKGRAYVWQVPARDGPVPSSVWVEGQVVAPIHPCVPAAAGRDPELYRALAALDALRVGRVREQTSGLEALGRMLGVEVSR